MSKLSDQVFDVLKSLFPGLNIQKEVFVFYKGQKLFLDFWIPQLSLIVEVHGPQHDGFVEHFHGDERGFRESKRRDKIKEEWAASCNQDLIALHVSDLPLTESRFLELMANK
jgi:hypothetical protein